MKTLFLFTLTLVLALNLNARENPFEATNAYEEEAARIIEQEEIDQNSINESAYIKEMQEKMSQVSDEDANKNKVKEAIKKLTPILKVEKTYTKKEVKKLIKKAQVQSESKVKKLVKKEIEKTIIVEPKQVVYVKPRADIIDDEMTTKELLDFIKVEYNNDKIIIHTDYKVAQKFTLEKEKKIIIDYKAKLNFYTKRDVLSSKEFKKIAIGNHKKERYFRVVLEVANKPSSYKVNYTDDLITIISPTN